MLWTPAHPFFQFNYFTPSSASLTAHASANTKASSYTEAINGSVLTTDIYFIEITFAYAGGTGSATKNQLCDIGIDPANGGSYTVLINNLLTCNAGENGGINGGSPVTYRFPLRIAAGTQIGARIQGNAGGTTCTMRMRIWGAPRHPELCRAGTYVTTFGANTATSRGTSITPGTGAKGNYVDIGAAPTSLPHWYFDCGLDVADTTMTNGEYFVDVGIGDSSNKFLAVRDLHMLSANTERLGKAGLSYGDGYYDAPAGVSVYGRASFDTTPDSSVSMCIYGVGG